MLNSRCNSNKKSLQFRFHIITEVKIKPYLQACQSRVVIDNVNKYFLEEKANRGPISLPLKAVVCTDRDSVAIIVSYCIAGDKVLINS